MKVLAVDTSTMTTSAALVEGPRPAAAPLAQVAVLAAHERAASPSSDNLLPLIERVLGDAGVALAAVDGFAVGAGPGSFTGLRIGMATVKGLAFASGRPLWAVSSLQALALDAVAAGAAAPGDLIAAVVDARRGEVFTGWWRAGAQGVTGLGEERVIAPEELVRGAVALPPGTRLLVGDGARAYRDALAGVGKVGDDLRATPSAISVGRLALSAGLPDVLTVGAPAYIRPSEAEIKFPQGNPGGTFSGAGGGKPR